ncbi:MULTISPECIES: cytidine deaminase [Nonlabens]|nr:cytidine deaminase [Nonlabens xylanidelens]PQJ13809.1 cytidine deaminase [Nonlabens xylanidelens]
MKKLELHTTLEVYDNIEELAAPDHSLMDLAIEARHRAYAPYSNFTVGCALLLENGEIITGNNQENAAYPSGLCAERVAIFAAGSQYPGVAVLKMAITASPKDDSFHKPVPPCGACRQSIAEYENNQENDIELYFMGAAGKVLKSDSLSDLLPLVFDKNYL